MARSVPGTIAARSPGPTAPPSPPRPAMALATAPASGAGDGVVGIRRQRRHRTPCTAGGRRPPPWSPARAWSRCWPPSPGRPSPGPALLLGLADVTVMTPDAFAFLSGPDAVESFTGIRVSLHDLGGSAMHATASGLCALMAADEPDVLDLVGARARLSPRPHRRRTAPIVGPPTTRRALSPRAARRWSRPRARRPTTSATSSPAMADDGELLELRAGWAPQLVTALASVGGMPIGVVANQPRSMAGTLDIPASQKGARFVRFCDAFNLPIAHPGGHARLPPGQGPRVAGHDPPRRRAGLRLRRGHRAPGLPRPAQGLWRGLHRHGLQGHGQRHLPGLALGPGRRHGRARVPSRSCTGAPTPRSARRLEAHYAEEFLTPWVAAERGFVDEVIDPADTRAVIHRRAGQLATRREHLVGRKHDSGADVTRIRNSASEQRRNTRRPPPKRGPSSFTLERSLQADYQPVRSVRVRGTPVSRPCWSWH